MTTIPVALSHRPYPVNIDPGLLDEVGATTRKVAGGRSAYVITDTHVGPRYADRVAASLTAANYTTKTVTFAAGEPNKTLATVSSLLDEILTAAPPPDRASVIVALGGGVVGDVAGFVAATLLRGVSLIQVPTSLLADVDSFVGGKTGVDHPTGKNLIGAFHQPRAVCIDTDALATLPDIEMTSGLAECVKHGVIRDASLLTWIEGHADALLARDANALTELISRNVAIKSAIVSADERESGVRAHLNFGHTIGHAIEAVESFTPDDVYLRHGHCVALGMVAANRIAIGHDLLSEEQASRVENLLVTLGLPVRRVGGDGDKLLAIMRYDKKSRGGTIRFVLPSGSLGRVDIHADVTDEEILAAIDYLSQ